MSFFGNFSGLRASQAKMPEPVRKPPCIMHPENAPRTIGDTDFPDDFDQYEYAGATLETVAYRDTQGEVKRRPAMVARMIRKYQSADGASAVEEMTASIADLFAYQQLVQAGVLGSLAGECA